MCNIFNNDTLRSTLEHSNFAQGYSLLIGSKPAGKVLRPIACVRSVAAAQIGRKSVCSYMERSLFSSNCVRFGIFPSFLLTLPTSLSFIIATFNEALTLDAALVLYSVKTSR